MGGAVARASGLIQISQARSASTRPWAAPAAAGALVDQPVTAAPAHGTASGKKARAGCQCRQRRQCGAGAASGAAVYRVTRAFASWWNFGYISISQSTLSNNQATGRAGAAGGVGGPGGIGGNGGNGTVGTGGAGGTANAGNGARRQRRRRSTRRRLCPERLCQFGADETLTNNSATGGLGGRWVAWAGRLALPGWRAPVPRGGTGGVAGLANGGNAGLAGADGSNLDVPSLASSTEGFQEGRQVCPPTKTRH